MTGKRILLLSASIGHGHVRAADGLAAGLKRWFPGNESCHADIMELVPALFRLTYKDMYIKLVKSFPEFWGYLYARSDNDGDSKLYELRKKMESAASGGLEKLIGDYRPDHIICTHFTPQQVLGGWKARGRLQTPLWTCITDFVAHRYWLEPNMDGYFTASQENVFRMRRRGLTHERIFTHGIPVLPDFIPPCDPELARREAAAAFSLNPARKTFVLMGGGAGIGDMRGLSQDLLSLEADFQLVALTGKNEQLLAEMRQMAAQYPDRLFPLGFTNEVHKLLAASDLVLSKPGGLTTVECLAMGKPMLIYSSIPGQEDYNADYLLENGAAMKAPDNSGIIWRIVELLADPERLRRMAVSAAVLGKPEAARNILDTVLNYVS